MTSTLVPAIARVNRPEMKTSPRPLFIPLKREWFERFRDGSKRIEWRAYGPRWNTRVAHRGRRVTLSLGYSGARLSGTVLRCRRVHASRAPDVARSIYPRARFLCAIYLRVQRGEVP